MGRHDEWVARDAAVVWHGFTQMDSFAENAPVLVERGEGHELIDVDGRRYLDATSSPSSTTRSGCNSSAARTPPCSATATSWSSSSPRHSRESYRSTTRTSS